MLKPYISQEEDFLSFVTMMRAVYDPWLTKAGETKHLHVSVQGTLTGTLQEVCGHSIFIFGNAAWNLYLLTPFPRAWLLWTHSTTFGQNLNLTHKHLTLSAKCGFFCCWGWWMSLETTHRFTFNFSLASPYLQVRWRSIELTSSNMWVGRRCFDNFRLVGTTCNTPSLSHLQVIQLTRISFSQLTVQQFFSLYKAFHIWPNKVRRVGECLIHDTIVVFFWLVHAYYCHK